MNSSLVFTQVEVEVCAKRSYQKKTSQKRSFLLIETCQNNIQYVQNDEVSICDIFTNINFGLFLAGWVLYPLGGCRDFYFQLPWQVSHPMFTA